MSTDGTGDGGSRGGGGVPTTSGDTGVQRALGERRRRRQAERSGRVDLDATMSQWPVVDPPTSPRPVVRPARPTLAGVATAPVLPPPGALVVGPLLEQRRAAERREVGDPDPRRSPRRARATGKASAAGAAGAAGAARATGTSGTAGTAGATVDRSTDGPDRRRPEPAARADEATPDPTPDPTPAPSAGSAPAQGTEAAPAPGDPDWEADLVRAAAPQRRTRRRPAAPAGAAAGATAASGPAAAAAAAGGPAAPVDASVGAPVGAPLEAPRSNPGPTPAPTAPSLLPAQAPGQDPDAPTTLVGRVRALRWPSGRRGLLAAAAVLAALLLLGALLVGLLGRGEDPSQAVAPVDEAPAQQTLALTVQGADGVVGGLVLGVDSARVSTLLLPSDLLLEVADAGPQPLTRAVSLGADPVRRGLEDTLLLRVDGVVLLDPQQLGDLVDSVGGVVVDVSDEVVSDDVVVAAGPDQRLSGAQAVAYATLREDGEPVEAGLARLGEVVDGLLAALPTEPAAAQEALAAAGVAASSGMDDDELGTVVAAAAERAADGSTQSVVLPTRELTVGSTVRRGVDDEVARTELAGRFAGAVLPVAAVGEVRVVVRNGVGTPGLVGAARDRLVRAGLRYTGGGNTTEFGQTETVVLVASSEDEDRARGAAVALALGLGEDVLQVNNESMVDTDVVVVLGEDFARLADGNSPSDAPTTGDAP